MRNIEAGVRADGLGCLAGGFLGTPGMSASPSLVSVEKTTGATSRVIAWSIAFWLVLLSCLPKFAGLIVNMPRPVMAAALFFNGALMLVAGMQIIASRPDHASGHAGNRIFDPGGNYCGDLSRVLQVASKLDTTVHRFDHFDGGDCFRAAQRPVLAGYVALSSIASWDRFDACYGRDRSTCSSRSRPRNGRFLRRTRRECAPSWIRPSNMSRPMPMGRWKSKWGAIRSTSW